jgi:RNA polymerase sigma factor (sigma-70 family)
MLATMSERASASAVAQSATGSASAPAVARPQSRFDQLIVDHQQQITRLVHRLLGWSPDVEDVVQDVFVDAFKSFSKFNAQASVQTWLTRIAINRCRSHQRKQWIRRMFPLPLEESRGERAVDQLDQQETHSQVHAAIQQLNHRDRELIVLRYLEEQPIDAIANTLNLKPNVVNVRLNRARARLEKILRPILES